MPKKDAGAAAVVGPGAQGALLAASLRSAGYDVLLIGRVERSTRLLRRRGIRVTGPSGRTRTLRGFSSRIPKDRVEAVFVCVKSGSVRSALAKAHRAAGPKTAVVSLLNGLSHARLFRGAFGSRAVIGVSQIASARTAPGAVRHAGGDIVQLAAGPRNREAARAAGRVLRRAGWKVRTVRSEERLLWTKLAVNAAVNPLGALTGMTNDALAASPPMRELMTGTALEAVRIAKAAGFPPLTARLPEKIVRSCLRMPGQHNSMAQDMLAGRPTEAEAILGPFVAAARRTKTPSRFIAPLLRMVRRLEAELR